ncbi:hypothetical protein GM418_15330 [Maribellus comscasis]|uniref:Uncharacterized protein n=1 Tax=Maribellus comscasis TaxID=2681766 RepID=A0A6I6K4R6_9BACT|nr:hypothetical protein [Maribellus comscasis]QGY44994.1 hypothetical protein GM418_15330 [Maribellus comscasis]
MKRIFGITTVLVCAAFLLSSFSLRENPQDPPRGKKKERHIKLVKVDEDGNKTELDTILSNDDFFVWNGDTIGGGMKWFSKREFVPDSLLGDMDFDFDFDVDSHGKGNVFVLKSDGDSTLEYRFDMRKDDLHGDHDVMVWHGDKGENRIFVAPKVPGVPPVPPVPRLHFLENANTENIIDLSDPGIISYKKKKMKDGKEKITIVRTEPGKVKTRKVEEIIINEKGGHATSWSTPKVHKVVVAKTKDGKTRISDDENVFHLDGEEETVKVIQEEGKVIRIKEVKRGDKKDVEVEVEVEESEENN